MNCIIRRNFLLDKKKRKENGTIATFVLFSFYEISLFFFLPNFVTNDYINNYFTFDYHVLLFSGFYPFPLIIHSSPVPIPFCTHQKKNIYIYMSTRVMKYRI